MSRDIPQETIYVHVLDHQGRQHTNHEIHTIEGRRHIEAMNPLVVDVIIVIPRPDSDQPDSFRASARADEEGWSNRLHDLAVWASFSAEGVELDNSRSSDDSGHLANMTANADLLGSCWADSWGDFDGRTLEDQLGLLRTSPEAFAESIGACTECRLWTDYCSGHEA